ncbi:inositol monophosphatase family protein [Kitasatospora sp. NPDC002227]|uniref:inositol monophosphatase family protein n=1 Tax=Kitasatospora sp. NPDC002227 TaxID=3154773 RepID=UPI00331F334E
MLTSTDLATLLPAVTAAVREVGELLAARQSPRPMPGVTLEDAFAVFAELDEPASALLRERLTALRPQAGWLDDELTGAAPADGEWWSCDATDGAVQYLSGLAHWAVTATLLQDGEPVLAVIHAPLEGHTYTAVRGGGARLNGEPVTPPRRDLRAAVAGTSHSPQAGTDPVARRRAGQSLSAVLADVLAVRNLGPTALQVAHVASGALSLFWLYGTDPANLLPGALIAREAGATVTCADGTPWEPTATSFVAAAPSLHADLVTTLATVS